MFINIKAGPAVKKRFLPKGFVEQVFLAAQILKQKILKNLTPMQRKFWYDENSTFSQITEISSKFLHPEEFPSLNLKMTKLQKTEFVREELNKLNKKLPGHIYLPTNPDAKIIDILPNSAFSLQSAKKVPFIVSFIGQHYDGPDSDYIVKNMSISEYVFGELMTYDNNRRNQLGLNGNNNIEFNTLQNSKFNNKSTAHSVMIQNEERIIHNLSISVNHNNNIEINPANRFMSNNILDVDDSSIINDDFENFHDLTIPHIDIKVFKNNSKPNSVVGDNDEFKEPSIVKELEYNLDNLSNCTIEEAGEEDIVNENLSNN